MGAPGLIRMEIGTMRVAKLTLLVSLFFGRVALAQPAPEPPPTPRPAPAPVKLETPTSSLKLGLLLQPQYEAAGSATLRGVSNNLFVRRARFLAGATLFKT